MKKGSWEVIVVCSVRKSIICENCTKEEAEKNPFDYAVDETELEQIDWDVERVKENE